LAASVDYQFDSNGIIDGAWRATQVVKQIRVQQRHGSIHQQRMPFFGQRILDGPILKDNAGCQRGSCQNHSLRQSYDRAKSVSISFASVVLGNKKNMSATATAGYQCNHTFCGFIPLAVLINGNLTN